MPDLWMRADLHLKMRDGESKDEAEDRLIDLIEMLDEQGLKLVGWAGETEVVDDA